VFNRDGPRKKLNMPKSRGMVPKFSRTFRPKIKSRPQTTVSKVSKYVSYCEGLGFGVLVVVLMLLLTH